MALVGNRSVLHKSPGRFLSGTVASGDRSNLNKSGMMANRFQAMDPLSAAVPAGHLAPSAWALPRTSGGMSSHNECALTISSGATGALGFNLIGTASLTLDASGVGGLIAGGVGTATLSIGASADIAATVGGVGTATISLSASAVTGALGWLQGESTLHVSGTMVSYAIGWMSGTTEESGMTAAGIANTVWSKIIEGPYSADQILRLLAAHAAGAATGLEGANPQFTGIDGVTLRIDGTYAAGNRTIDSLNGA